MIPATKTYIASAPVLLKATIAAAMHLGYTISAVSDTAGLVSFSAAEYGVTGSALVQSNPTSIPSATLTVSAEFPIVNILPQALLFGGGGALLGLFSRGRWRRRVVEDLLATVDRQFGVAP